MNSPLQTQINWPSDEDFISTLSPEERQLEDSGITYIERQLVERGELTFCGEDLTGTTKIQSSADVAFLFKNLESAANEHLFAVMLRPDNTYSVLYLSTGTSNGTLMDKGQIISAACELEADRVIFVHNHPSGGLKASLQDMLTHGSIKSALNLVGKTLLPSVIINLDSGKFVEFDSGRSAEFLKRDYAKKEINKAKVCSFDKLKLYTPADERTKISCSKDVALFLSRQKRGTTGKIQLLTLNTSSVVTRYALYDDSMPIKELSAQIIKETCKHGDRVILSSNGALNEDEIKIIQDDLALADIKLLDFLYVKQDNAIIDNYLSFSEEGLLPLSEPVSEYNDKKKYVKQPNYDLNTSGTADNAKAINFQNSKILHQFPAKIGGVEITAEVAQHVISGKKVKVPGIKRCTGEIVNGYLEKRDNYYILSFEQKRQKQEVNIRDTKKGVKM
ncbi:MAG: JAB domain-containing protein [Bacteroidales bacterium]|jgi:DNA repair protein RadC|nr:JAB domain-containing protein [Bacteroidales bacterium]